MKKITTKAQLIEEFGTAKNAAQFIGISKQYVSMWPEVLPRKLMLLSTGAVFLFRESSHKQGDNQQVIPHEGMEAKTEAGTLHREHHTRNSASLTADGA